MILYNGKFKLRNSQKQVIEQKESHRMLFGLRQFCHSEEDFGEWTVGTEQKVKGFMANAKNPRWKNGKMENG